MKRALLTFLVLALAAPVSLVAEVEEEPGRGVARISLINGDVSVRRGDSGDWVAAVINAPLVVPDSIFVGAASRAEVQLDYANMVRLAANTEVRFSELEYRRYQLQLAKGTITFSVLRDSDADVDLSTPNVSVRPQKKGRYRVTVHEDGTTEITVRDGRAEIYTPRGVEELREGKTMMVRGPASDPEFQVLAAARPDEWDRWNERRDKELRRSRAYQYVSHDIYGAEDLDAYGEWIYVPPYGWVWSPRPWGWAPYHYGRWFHHGHRGWCWWPGGFHTRHFWRPALVAFFGWDSYSGFHAGIGVGFGFGRIGWVPLAPYERYYPWYGHRYYRGYRNAAYIDNSVHIVNNINVTNIYRNARVANAITAVDGTQFGRGRVSNVYRASSAELRRVSLVRGQLPVVPQRESQRFTDREVRIAKRPATRLDTQNFYSRRKPVQVERVPFSQQQHPNSNKASGGWRSELLRGWTARGRARAPKPPPRSRRASPGSPPAAWSFRRLLAPAGPVLEHRAPLRRPGGAG